MQLASAIPVSKDLDGNSLKKYSIFVAFFKSAVRAKIYLFVLANFTISFPKVSLIATVILFY